MRQILLKCLPVLLVLGFATSASATPIQWTLTNVFFNDGASAVGSFVFDATTGVYSAVQITTSPAGATYVTSDVAPNFGSDANGLNLIAGFLPVGNNTGFRLLNLDFLTPLTNGGGVVGLLAGFPSFEGTCAAVDCGSGRIDREVARGSVTAAVPEPMSLVLVVGGLAVLVAKRRVIG